MAKICHITSAHTRDDIRIFVKECVTLANVGHEVSLIVADNLPDEIRQNVQIYSVGKPKNRKTRMRQIPLKIYDRVVKLHPDFIHFHDPELILIGNKLVKQKYKVIYDVHEDLPKQVLNKYYLPRLIRKPISLIVSVLEKYYARKFHGIVAATPIIARRFKQYNINTIDLCNYPILDELNVAYNDWENRQNCMCYIGSISRMRGIMPIIASSAISHLTLELAGIFSGDISLDELKIQPGGKFINYLGILNRQEIASLLRRVKIGMVTLLPTASYVESLPIKMFEYMLSGIPVIASNFPLWQDIVAKYDCGILVNPEDSEEIAKAAQELLANQDKARQMGINGRNLVLKRFNWEKEQQKLIDFYK